MWRIITEEDVLDAMSEPEMTAYRTVALKPGQADPLLRKTTKAVNMARGYIMGNKVNKLAEGETLPEGMIESVVDIIRYSLQSRLPTTIKEERKDAKKDAILYLKDISRGTVAIEQPEGIAEDTAKFPSATPTVKSRIRRFSRRQQDGI